MFQLFKVEAVTSATLLFTVALAAEPRVSHTLSNWTVPPVPATVYYPGQWTHTFRGVILRCFSLKNKFEDLKTMYICTKVCMTSSDNLAAHITPQIQMVYE